MRLSFVFSVPLFATSLWGATVTVPEKNVTLPVAFATGGGGAVASAAASQTALSSATTTPAITVFGGSEDSGAPPTPAMEEAESEAPAPPPKTSHRASLPEYQQRKINRTKRKSRVTVAPPSDTHISGPKGGYVAPPIEIPNSSPLILRGEGGYQSKYVYHGIDQVQYASFDFTGFNAANNPVGDGADTNMWYLGAGLQWQGFSLSAKYVRSIDDFSPFYDPSTFPALPRSEEYEEYVFDLNYTLGILDGGLLDATAGAELRYFEESAWWNTDAIYAFYARLKSNKNPLVRPSFTYYYKDAAGVQHGSKTFISGGEVVSGQEFVFQIDGELTVAEFGPVTVGTAYYAEVAYYHDNHGDFDLDGVGHYGGGVSLPVSVAGFTLSPGLHYHENGIDLEGNFGEGDVIPKFWWGINGSFTF